jgi:hypothetical protein
MTKGIPITKGEYQVAVPVRVIYRLESDQTVVKQEDGTLPIPFNRTVGALLSFELFRVKQDRSP